MKSGIMWIMKVYVPGEIQYRHVLDKSIFFLCGKCE